MNYPPIVYFTIPPGNVPCDAEVEAITSPIYKYDKKAIPSPALPPLPCKTILTTPAPALPLELVDGILLATERAGLIVKLGRRHLIPKLPPTRIKHFLATFFRSIDRAIKACQPLPGSSEFVHWVLITFSQDFLAVDSEHGGFTLRGTRSRRVYVEQVNLEELCAAYGLIHVLEVLIEGGKSSPIVRSPVYVPPLHGTWIKAFQASNPGAVSLRRQRMDMLLTCVVASGRISVCRYYYEGPKREISEVVQDGDPVHRTRFHAYQLVLEAFRQDKREMMAYFLPLALTDEDRLGGLLRKIWYMKGVDPATLFRCIFLIPWRGDAAVPVDDTYFGAECNPSLKDDKREKMSITPALQRHALLIALDTNKIAYYGKEYRRFLQVEGLFLGRDEWSVLVSGAEQGGGVELVDCLMEYGRDHAYVSV